MKHCLIKIIEPKCQLGCISTRIKLELKMLKESLLQIFERDLNKLKDEISFYKDEKSLWIVKNEISNSAGNLCLHLVGNLNHFIGTALGKTGYVRNRENEFAAKNISREELVIEIEKTILVVTKTLNNLSSEDFEKIFLSKNMERLLKQILCFYIC